MLTPFGTGYFSRKLACPLFLPAVIMRGSRTGLLLCNDRLLMMVCGRMNIENRKLHIRFSWYNDLLGHPKSGSSWEGYVIEETIKSVEPDEVYYWATHGGAEIDLILLKQGRMLGVECKRADAPRMTPSMRTALAELKLEQIAVVYPGTKRYSVDERVAVVPLEAVADGMKGLLPKRA